MEIRHKETDEVLLELSSGLLGINLLGIKLPYANLIGKNLENQNLRMSDLSHAELTSAQLAFASLACVDLSYANLTEATLCGTILSDANLSHANLSRTALQDADFTAANLDVTDFTGAVLDGTLFINCHNLHRAMGLAHVEHQGPSILDVRTIRASINHLPDVFLYGVGYTEEEVKSLRRFYSESYYTSHGHNFGSAGASPSHTKS